MNNSDHDRYDEARRLIRAGELRQAIRLHRSAFRQFGDPLFPDLRESDLQECVSTPLPIFSFCAPDELAELRERMAAGLVMRIGLFGGKSDFHWTHQMSAKAVEQNFWISIMGHRNWLQWMQSGAVLRAKILNSGDGGCAACRLAACRDYAIAEAPLPPLAGCENLNTVGCRCILMASRIKGIDLE